MLLFLCLRFDINESNWDQLTESKVPMFAMVFSGWCRNCMTAVPGFDNFSAQYENDEEIVVGKVNCTTDSEFCRGVVQGETLPMFIVKAGGLLQKIKLPPIKPYYDKVVDRLTRLREGVLVEEYDGPMMSFPTFLFRMSGTDKEGMEIAERAVLRTDYLQVSYFYSELSAGEAERELVVMLDKQTTVKMNAEFTEEAILKFINDYRYSLITEDWNFASLKTSERKFALIVTPTKINQNSFKEIAKKHIHTTIFGVLSGERFSLKRAQQQFRLNKTDLPAIVLVNATENKFAVLPNADTEESVEEFLMKGANNELDMEEIEMMRFETYEDHATFYFIFKVVMSTFIFVVIACMIWLWNIFRDDVEEHTKQD